MKLFFLAILWMATAIVCAEEVSQDDPVNDAVFASGPKLDVEVTRSHARYVGLLQSGLNDYGISYVQNILPKTKFWSRMTYGDQNYGSITDSSVGSNMMVEVKEKGRAQIVFGVDQVIHLTSNKSWGFILGLGAGYRQSQYEAQFYPKVCTPWCGYSLSQSESRTQRDQFLFLENRIGLTFLNINVANLKGVLNIMGSNYFLRTPESVELVDQNGGKHKMDKSGTLLIEALVEI